MDRPAIVIRDIHRYGDDLTVPEAIVRLCGGDPITSYLLGAPPPLSGAPRPGQLFRCQPGRRPGAGRGRGRLLQGRR
jgi:hypothetical protein